MTELHDPRAAFITAAVWHGPLDRAEAILSAHPGIASVDIHTAALLGDDAAVRRFLALDPASATAPAPPLGWDPLTHLCFSRYLRLDPGRSAGFLRAATALLDAGAGPKAGFFDLEHRPEPEWESVLYGAAGVAHHPGMTRLLLERGADPNDEEVPYHAPETHDNAALRVLVEIGGLTPDSLATMLLRKADWHDHEGIRFLLEHGADPNRMTRWHHTALHQALRRDNDLENIDALLDHGAEPTLANRLDGRSAVSMALRRGRADVLASFERRGVPLEFHGVERLLAACVRNDAAAVRAIADREPGLVREVLRREARCWRSSPPRRIPPRWATCSIWAWMSGRGMPQGDAYFGIAPDSTALHVAAWRAWHQAVRFLHRARCGGRRHRRRGPHPAHAGGQGVRGLVLVVPAVAGVDRRTARRRRFDPRHHAAHRVPGGGRAAHERGGAMIRPEELTRDAPLTWSTGRGTDVWELFSACIAGDLAAVRRLVERDPAIVRCHFRYRKPLYFAVRENRLDVVAFLLERDPDPTGLAVHDSLLDIARDRGYREMERLLEETLAGRHNVSTRGEAVAALIRARDPAGVRRLLDAEPELVGAGDGGGSQPIHWAAMTRQPEIIDDLVARGADLDARRPDGARPIQLANGDYHYRGWDRVPRDGAPSPREVVEHLRARGAECDICTRRSHRGPGPGPEPARPGPDPGQPPL